MFKTQDEPETTAACFHCELFFLEGINKHFFDVHEHHRKKAGIFAKKTFNFRLGRGRELDKSLPWSTLYTHSQLLRLRLDRLPKKSSWATFVTTTCNSWETTYFEYFDDAYCNLRGLRSCFIEYFYFTWYKVGLWKEWILRARVGVSTSNGRIMSPVIQP